MDHTMPARTRTPASATGNRQLNQNAIASPKPITGHHNRNTGQAKTASRTHTNSPTPKRAIVGADDSPGAPGAARALTAPVAELDGRSRVVGVVGGVAVTRPRTGHAAIKTDWR